MSEITKNIDKLMQQRSLKQGELAELGEEISKSSHEIVVVFVDLADSTLMKASSDPEEWLGQVYEFIRRCEHLALASNGTVVKRIGDEVMITFAQSADSEKFIHGLASDEVLAKHRFKVSVDAGSAYHFQFLSHLEDDPYGPVVDRCARISKLARAGFAIVSSKYVDLLEDGADYLAVGNFHLKGFKQPVELHVRSLYNVDTEEYLADLLQNTNENTNGRTGYKTTAKLQNASTIRSTSIGRAKPFLTRELLNVPKLPYSPETYLLARKSAADRDEFEVALIGYLLEWEGTVSEVKREDEEILLRVEYSEHEFIRVTLPRNYWEILRELRPGQNVFVRGVIQSIFIIIHLNYADVTLL